MALGAQQHHIRLAYLGSVVVNEGVAIGRVMAVQVRARRALAGHTIDPKPFAKYLARRRRGLIQFSLFCADCMTTMFDQTLFDHRSVVSTG